MKILSAVDGVTEAVSQKVQRAATLPHQLSLPRMSLAMSQRTAM
jgi:hypothetical protein